MKLTCKISKDESIEFVNILEDIGVKVRNKEGMVMTLILDDEQVEKLARKLIRKPAIVLF